jgi:hypothetical protein
MIEPSVTRFCKLLSPDLLSSNHTRKDDAQDGEYDQKIKIPEMIMR